MAKYKIYIDHDTSLNTDEKLSQQMGNYYDKGMVALDFIYLNDGPLYIKKANTTSFKRINLELESKRIDISVDGLKNRLPAGVQSLMNNPYYHPFSYIGSGLTNGSTIFGDFVA
jgi:hypothetical protein